MRFPVSRKLELSRRACAALCFAAAALAAACDSPSGPRPAGEVAQAAVVSGDLQTAPVASAAAPLVVRLTDAKGKPVPGRSVQFVVTAGNGSVAPATATSDANGTATAAWTLGTAARDTQRVEARVADASGAVLATAVFRAVGTPGAPAKLVALAGGGQTGPAGSPLPDSLRVRLTDQWDNPVAGQGVAWSVLSGGGSVAPAAASTDSGGVARTAWTLGTRVDTAQAAAASFPGVPADTFLATATPQGTLAKVRGDAQSGAAGEPLADSLVVVLTSPSGQPVRGAAVTWQTTSGSVVPAVTRTDAAGRAATWWLPGGDAGTVSATARVEGGPSATFTATIAAPPPPRVEVVSGDGQTAYGGARLPQQLVVRVVDGQGQPLRGVNVDWTLASTAEGFLVSIVDPTRADGASIVEWTLPSEPGTHTVHAAIALPDGRADTAEFNATSLGPVSATIVSGDMAADTVGSPTPITLVARLVDAQGNGIAGVHVEWASQWNRATVTDADTLTAADGTATAHALATGPSGSDSVYARFEMRDTARPALPSALVAFTVNVLPGAPAGLTIISPVPGSTLGVGTTYPVTAAVVDRHGNRVRRAGVPISFSATGVSAQPSPAQVMTDGTGQATASWTPDAGGSATLLASSPGLSTGSASYPVGPAARLELADTVADGFVYVYMTQHNELADSVVARTRAYATRLSFRLVSGQGTDGPFTWQWRGNIPLNAIYGDESWVYVEAYTRGVVVRDSIQFRSPQALGPAVRAAAPAAVPSSLALGGGWADVRRATGAAWVSAPGRAAPDQQDGGAGRRVPPPSSPPAARPDTRGGAG